MHHTTKKDLKYCIDNKLNPNPNPEGQLFSLGTKEEIEIKGKAAAQRIKNAFKKRDENET